MNYIFYLFFILLNSNYLNAQTSNTNANNQLEELKTAILNSNYKKIIDYTYPKIYHPLTKEQMRVTITSMFGKMKEEGFEIVDVSFLDPSEIVKNGNELQFTIDENLFVKTPKGLVKGIYTFIGISIDNGLNWKFIDTSGKSKEEVLKKLPNLSSELVIKPAKKNFIDTETPSN